MKKSYSFVRSFALAALLAAVSTGSYAQAPALPSAIQDGNILHCFDWKLSDIQAELPAIAQAGFGAVQISPMQGNAGNNAEWYFAYMPYDMRVMSGGIGDRNTLKSLCTEAEKYGIKIIVDVVANHINGDNTHRASKWNNTSLWHSTSFNKINYGSRQSIIKDCLGDYPDLNSEHNDVQQAVKTYVEDLKSYGVKGIRWDAAKHIGLPSEQCNFWPAVTSVAGMYHYGELLDGPGGNKYTLIKEYTKYMSVTDTEYSDWVLNEVKSGRVPSGHGSWSVNGVESSKLVYWGESHDTYANDGGKTKTVSQNVIDRAWAIGAARNGESALYLSRPFATGRRDIRMGVKGSTHFKDKEIAAVNHLKNAAVGAPDYYTGSNGIATITRRGVGACIVLASGGNRNVSVSNGGSYVPAGTYQDLVSGNTFTVSSSTISGTVGSTGIAVICKDGVVVDPTPDPDPKPDPTPDPVVPADMPDTFYVIGEVNGNTWDPAQGVAMRREGASFVADLLIDGYFSFARRLGNPGDWNSFNASGNRFGASDDTTLPLGGEAGFSQLNDPKAYNVPSARKGVTYTITANWATKKIMVKEYSGIDDVETVGGDVAPVYYDMRGMELRGEPEQPGLYIRRCGSKVEKVIVR